jgi:hypothetical protein
MSAHYTDRAGDISNQARSPATADCRARDTLSDLLGDPVPSGAGGLA